MTGPLEMMLVLMSKGHWPTFLFTMFVLVWYIHCYSIHLRNISTGPLGMMLVLTSKSHWPTFLFTMFVLVWYIHCLVVKYLYGMFLLLALLGII